MKTLKLITAIILLTGTATFAVAGPGPQYWAQQTKNQKQQSDKTTTEPAKDTKVCANCSCNCACAKKA